MIYNPTMTFENIEEIKFTIIGEDTFSISIKSDIEFNKEMLKDMVFEAKLCKLDPTFELNCNREYTYVTTPNGCVINSEYYNIPINIQLLLNQELNQFFSIRKEL